MSSTNPEQKPDHDRRHGAILAVATNAAPELNGKRSGLYLSELTHFLEVIADAGYDYDIVSPAGGKIPLDENSVTARQRRQSANARFLDQPEFLADLDRSRACADIDVDDYAAIYLAGGHGTMWDFRQSEELADVIGAFHGTGRPVSAVCHGVSGLVDVTEGSGQRLVQGRRVTGFTNLEDRIGRTISAMPYLLEDALVANGARFHKNRIPFTSRVEVDDGVLTGQNPQSARALADALVTHLAGGG